MTYITATDLAKEVGMNIHSILNAILLKRLRATRASSLRGAGIYTTSAWQIDRASADEWIARRAARMEAGDAKRKKKEEAKQPKLEKRGGDGMAFCPNKDDDTMGMAWIDDLKTAALSGDLAARERIQRPFGEGGLGISVWLQAGIGG